MCMKNANFSTKMMLYDYDQKSYVISIGSWTKWSTSEVTTLPHTTNEFAKRRLNNVYLISHQFDK